MPDDSFSTKHKDVAKSADAYVAARDERMEGTRIEVAAKEELIKLMQQHKLKIYRDPDSDVVVELKLTPESIDVKVKQAKPKKEDAEDDDGEGEDEL